MDRDVRFEWDERKNLESESKHGVSFHLAQHAFLDPNRVIGEDKTHGLREDHHFCLGRVGNGIITVRFTFRADVIRIFGPDIGEKENGSMSEKIQYKNGPKGDWRVVDDFLPPPDQLVLKEEQVKITIALSRESVDFFKKEARKRQIPYQKMIRRVIDLYADHFRQGV